MIENKIVIRPEKLITKYLTMAHKEASHYIEPKTSGIKSKMGNEAITCQGCEELLDCSEISGYKRCSSCGSFNSSPRLKPELIKDLWDEGKSADFFHKFIYPASIENRKIFLQKRFKNMINHIKKGKILEVGCARGLYLDILKQNGFCAEGVEVLQYPVQCCLEKGHFIYKDSIENVRLKKNYDAVVAWEVLSHIENLTAFFDNIHRCLKGGGFLFITISNATALEYDDIWEDGIRHHDNFQPHIFLQIFSLNGIKKLLNKNGFNIIEMTTPGEMDVQNIYETAMRLNKKFNCDFFNDLFLNKKKNSQVHTNFQLFLQSNGYSGHCYVVAQKQN